MKIVYVSDVDISRPTGPGVNEREFVRTLLEESPERGDSGYAVIPTPDKGVIRGRDGCLYFHSLRGLRPASLRMFLLPLWILYQLKRRPVFGKDVHMFVIRLNRDILLLPLYLRLRGRPYAIKTLGNLYGFVPEESGLKDKVQLALVRKILGMVLKGAISVDVCTPQYLENYRAAYGLGNLILVENAVNVDLFRIMNREDCRHRAGLERFGRIIGYCGGRPSERGAGHLIEISPRLLKEFPDCGILIIGHDRGIPALKKRAETLGTSERIVFKGVVDYLETPPLINCMDVGIALDRAERLSSIGNSSQKVKQYLACGIPVICARNTNEAIIERGLGTGVNEDDQEELWEAVKRLMEVVSGEEEEERGKRRRFMEEHYSTVAAYEIRYRSWTGHRAYLSP
jgi:glycosyltransferase involved in cell wall biosynthesis